MLKRPSLALLRSPSLAIVLVAAFALFAVACGGDDDDGGSTSFATGTDGEYLTDICSSFDDLNAGILTAALSAGEDASDGEVAEALAGPFGEFVDAIQDARVPADLTGFHGDVVAAFVEIRDALEDGETSLLESDEGLGDLPDPPAGVRDRLNSAAVDLDECSGGNNPFEM